MRLHLPSICVAFTLLHAISMNMAAQAATSYGPEVSAEDFSQHVAALSSFSTDTKRKKYIGRQFNRLGLGAKQLKCQSQEQGLYVEIAAVDSGKKTVQYTAQLDDAYQTAGLLEIAERFMTQQPRPSHDIRFSFYTASQNQLTACPGLRTADLSIEPIGLDNQDAGSLVHYLNALYSEGK